MPPLLTPPPLRLLTPPLRLPRRPRLSKSGVVSLAVKRATLREAGRSAARLSCVSRCAIIHAGRSALEVTREGRYRPVSISIRDARSAQDRRWIQAHYPQYLQDLSPIDPSIGPFAARSEYAEREVELTTRWFMDESAHPLVILKDDRPVGFALVSRLTRGVRPSADFRLVDFFVAPKFRRLGIGRDAARLIFSRFAGSWELSASVSDKPAVTFWRSFLAEYTGGKVREATMDGEVRQSFESALPRPAHR